MQNLTSQAPQEQAEPKEDGGPAFARPLTVAGTGEFSDHQVGASLRDYFAAKALPVANKWSDELSVNTLAEILGIEYYQWAEHYPQVVAVLAYRIADGMIKARKG